MPIPTSAAIYRKIIDKHSINGSKSHKNLLQLLCYNYSVNLSNRFSIFNVLQLPKKRDFNISTN